MFGSITILPKRWTVTAGEAEPTTSVLKLGYAEAMLNGVATAITTPLTIPLAASIGSSDWQIGILTALPLLGLNLTQVPAARLSTSAGKPWLYHLLAGSLGRLAWLALAISMLVGRPNYLTLLSVATLASISTGLQTPLWTAFLGASVEEGRRGSYFGTRNLLAGACGLGAAFVSAWFVGQVGFSAGTGWALIVAVSASGLAVLAMAQAARLRCVSPVMSQSGNRNEPPRRDHDVLRSPEVRGYIVYGALLILGAGMATPFYAVHFINDLRGSPQIATTTMAVANAVALLLQGLWGPVMDRVGIRVLGGASLLAIAAVPALWMVALAPGFGVVAWMMNGVAWAACGLATFNTMLAISSDSNRASVVAWVNALQSPVNFAAPLLGGFVSSRVGMSPLFGAASLVLLTSLVCFLRTAPERARSS